MYSHPQINFKKEQSCKLLCDVKEYKEANTDDVNHVNALQKIIAQDYQQHW